MSRVKVYTRSMDMDLYRQSQELLTVPFPRARITDSSPLGYLLDAISDEEADYVINIDEDAFVFDNDALMDLLDYVIDNDFINCGMPDGGVCPHRFHNPQVTNPFFTIMNTKVLREHVTQYDYSDIDIPDPLEGFPHEILKHHYEKYSFEPYDGFYTWVWRNFPVKYLSADEHPDGITTILKNHNGKPFLQHTWYAREYQKKGKDYSRINSVIAESRKLQKKINRENELNNG